MKRSLLLATAALYVGMAYAQSADAVIMTINGKPIEKSEFEYSYNKNNSANVIDKKTVDEYVDLFVNYKLKVVAAQDAHLDTLSSFKSEYRQYRDELVGSTMVSDDDVVAEARNVYEQTKTNIGERGLIRPAHIFLRTPQKATTAELENIKLRVDSIYKVLLDGADFAELAKKVSQDRRSAARGGELAWIGPKQSLQEFEDAAYALKVGEMSKPVLTAAGYHIIKMLGRKQLEPFDSLKAQLVKFVESRNVRKYILNQRVGNIVKQSDNTLTAEQVMDARADSLMAADQSMRYLIQEYYDGLLAYEITKRNVWDIAEKDTVGLEMYFKKNRKNYKVTETKKNGKTKTRKAKSYTEVKVAVVADYQKKLEEIWIAELRNKYSVSVNYDVVNSVNNK